MKQTILIILIFPLVVFSQTPMSYQETLKILMKTENGIDSVYAEHEFSKVYKDKVVITTSNRHFHDTTLQPEYHKIKLHERDFTQSGYIISTFEEDKVITTYYFDKEQFLESKVTFKTELPVRVDIFNEDFELDYYLKFENGKWLTYRPEENWKPFDEQWKDFEMIKSMILGR
tara:strand:- start:14 stop:532 length:519 start_codon:yes stop_codon:yes gene_type:complete